MCEGSTARAVCYKAFLFRAEDFSALDVVGGHHYYACGPKFVEHIGYGDWTVVVQCDGVPLFVEKMVWFWSHEGGVIPVIQMAWKTIWRAS